MHYNTEMAPWEENPALYEAAKKVCHEFGVPWTDPRTGQTFPPPRKSKSGRKPAKKLKGRKGRKMRPTVK